VAARARRPDRQHELHRFEGANAHPATPAEAGFTNPFRVEYALVNVGALEGLGLAEVDLDSWSRWV